MNELRVLVVGLGTMGMSHALAYTRIDGFEVVGVCARGIDKMNLPGALQGAVRYSDFETALAQLKPDVVSINTRPIPMGPSLSRRWKRPCVRQPMALTVLTPRRLPRRPVAPVASC